MLEYNEFYLTLIRHGQSTVNMTPEIMGQRADVQLSAKGKKQAEALRNRFNNEGENFDYVFASPYTRALDTAKIATGNKQNIILAEDLREYDAGTWLDANRKEVLTDHVVHKMNVLHSNFLPPDGESLTQVERRASKWLEDNILYNKVISDWAIDARDNKKCPINIACFSHGMTIKCLLHYIMGFDKSFTWKVTIENTSISKLYFGKDGWRLISINDYAHLSTLKD
jgi:broad specificity phosphatase PhoE